MLNPEEYRDLQKHMRSLGDASLLRIVLLARGEYKSESMEIADEEVRRRKLERITLDEFSKKFPDEYYPHVAAFCPNCLNDTIDEPVGFLLKLFHIGVSLEGHESECDVCCSIVQAKWIYFIFPIFRIGKYRVKYWTDPGMLLGKSISRRLKPTSHH